MNIDMGIAYRHIRDPHTRTIVSFVCNTCLNKAEYDDVRGTLFQHAVAISNGWRDHSTFDDSVVECPECSGTAKPALPSIPRMPAIPVPPIAAPKKRASSGRKKWGGR